MNVNFWITQIQFYWLEDREKLNFYVEGTTNR